MPSKKIFIVLIVCAGFVISVMIFQWGTKFGLVRASNKNVSVVDPVENDPNSNLKNWQAVLSKIGSTTVTTLSDTSTSEGEGTLTDKMAKDFFGQYLVLTQNGADVTEETALQIAQNTVSNPEYISSQGTVYTEKNLRIEKIVNSSTKDIYSSALFDSIKKRSPKNSENELYIFSRAVQEESQTELQKLDPIILAYKGIIADMLEMKVPSDIVSLHLELLNSASNILSNIQAMRKLFTDPVLSLSAVKQYEDNVVTMSLAIKKFGVYFSQ